MGKNQIKQFNIPLMKGLMEKEAIRDRGEDLIGERKERL